MKLQSIFFFIVSLLITILVSALPVRQELVAAFKTQLDGQRAPLRRTSLPAPAVLTAATATPAFARVFPGAVAPKRGASLPQFDGSELLIGLNQCTHPGPPPPPFVEVAKSAIRFITNHGGKAFVMGGSSLRIRELQSFTRQTGDVDLATWVPDWATFHQQVVSSGFFCILEGHLAMYVGGGAYKIDITPSRNFFTSRLFLPTGYPTDLLESHNGIPLLQLGPLVLQKQYSAIQVTRAQTSDPTKTQQKQQNDILDADAAIQYLDAILPMHFKSIISERQTDCVHHTQRFWHLVAQLHPNKYHELLNRWQQVLDRSLTRMSQDEKVQWETYYQAMKQPTNIQQQTSGP